jgi:hypothetical protein
MKLLIQQINLLNKDKIETKIEHNEIVKSETTTNNNNNNNHNNKNNSHKNNEDPINWDEKKVKECLESKNLEKLYLILSDQIDGKLLYQLYEMKTYTPEFYYKSLTKNDILDMNMVINLSKFLCNLFDDKNK